MLRACLAGVLLSISVLPVTLAAGQEAPLLTLTPRAEEIRRLELFGDVMRVRKRFREATEYYQQAFELNRRNAGVANKLGIAYSQMLDYRRARSWYERALKLDPNLFEPRNNLGMAYYAERNYKKARRHLEQALQLRPESASAHVNLGATYIALKKPEQAFQEYRLALLLDPNVFDKTTGPGVILHTYPVGDMAEFHFVLAKSYATFGDVDRCLSSLRRAFEEGFGDTGRLKKDPVFALLFEDVRFQELLASPPSPLRP